MNLPFSTHFSKYIPVIGGKPTYFIDRIWLCIAAHQLIDDALFRSEKNKYAIEHYTKKRENWDYYYGNNAKWHTIRKGNRFKKGDKLHMIVYNRTKNRFQFCPVLECTGTQDIFMTYAHNNIIEMSIDGTYFYDRERVALNDGFDSYDEFFYFFYQAIMKDPDQSFSGQIIHWTNLKY